MDGGRHRGEEQGHDNPDDDACDGDPEGDPTPYLRLARGLLSSSVVSQRQLVADLTGIDHGHDPRGPEAEDQGNDGPGHVAGNMGRGAIRRGRLVVLRCRLAWLLILLLGARRLLPGLLASGPEPRFLPLLRVLLQVKAARLAEPGRILVLYAALRAIHLCLPCAVQEWGVATAGL
jgi:hypothetical protein